MESCSLSDEAMVDDADGIDDLLERFRVVDTDLSTLSLTTFDDDFFAGRVFGLEVGTFSLVVDTGSAFPRTFDLAEIDVSASVMCLPIEATSVCFFFFALIRLLLRTDPSSVFFSSRGESSVSFDMRLLFLVFSTFSKSKFSESTASTRSSAFGLLMELESFLLLTANLIRWTR